MLVALLKLYGVARRLQLLTHACRQSHPFIEDAYAIVAGK
jgi:hypothetical protein